MITNLKKSLLLSAGILLAGGMTPDCMAETQTAAGVLNNLLTTAADTLTQQNQQPAQAPEQTQAQAAEQPQNTAPASAESSSNNETTLPTFDEGSQNNASTEVTSTAAMPVQETTVTETSMENKTPEAISSEPMAQADVTPIVSDDTTPAAATETAPAEAAPVVATETAPTPAPVATSTNAPTTKKIGFVDKNGNILIPPEGISFPAEMTEGSTYFFTKDVDALKQKIASGQFRNPFNRIQRRNGVNGRNSSWQRISQNGQSTALQQNVAQPGTTQIASADTAQTTTNSAQPTVTQPGTTQIASADTAQTTTNVAQPTVTQSGTTQIANANTAQTATNEVQPAVAQSGTTQISNAGRQHRQKRHFARGQKPITFMCYVAESPNMAPEQSAPSAPNA